MFSACVRTALLAALLLGCEDQGPNFSGTYDLFSIDGTALPVVSGGQSLISSNLDLNADGRFSEVSELVLPGGSQLTVVEEGTWGAPNPSNAAELSLRTNAGVTSIATVSGDALERRDPPPSTQVRLYRKR
jgi:hypothetical protein